MCSSYPPGKLTPAEAKLFTETLTLHRAGRAVPGPVPDTVVFICEGCLLPFEPTSIENSMIDLFTHQTLMAIEAVEQILTQRETGRD